jgi:hypothetical protein
METSNVGNKVICLPFDSEAEYEACVKSPHMYRKYIETQLSQYPELFPAEISSGFTFHDIYPSVKQKIKLRRIKISKSKEVFLIRPSFLMPYCIARTEQVEKALYLRQWGVPFYALTYVFGHSDMFWYRAWVGMGRNSIVGTTVKKAESLPQNLVVDEKHTWLEAEKHYVPTTVAANCILGATLVSDASAEALKEGYKEFVTEALALDPTYQPQTVCVDGWQATQQAWRELFPAITLILCFLHSIIKIESRCRAQLRKLIKEKAWHCYKGEGKREFAQRVRRFREWALGNLQKGILLEAVLKLCSRSRDFLLAYDYPQAHRTSNAVDRLMNHQDRLFYQMRYFHGSKASARLAVRAIALQWNFHPYSLRTQRSAPQRRSPFRDLNGFEYHTNWLHNLLIASSLGGLRL